jgi:predicted P-loop ATPase
MPLQTGLQLIRDLGLAVFPLNGQGKEAKAPLPACTGWQHFKAEDNARRLNDILNTKAYGVVIPPEIIILDFDLYKPDGTETFQSLSPIPQTLTFQTGRGGKHFWFRRPNILETQHIKVKKTHPDYPALEVLSKGCYIVGPGSTINGNLYPLANGEIADLPSHIWQIYHAVTKTPQQQAAEEKSEKVILLEAEERKYRLWLSHHPVAVPGDRDNRTYYAACKGKDFGLPLETIFDCLMHWQSMSSYKWMPEELMDKLKNGFQYGVAKPGILASDIGLFDEYEEELEESDPVDLMIHSSGFDTTRNGENLASIANCMHFFRIFRPQGVTDEVAKQANFLGLFKYNLMTEQVEFTRKPFWRNPSDENPLTLNDMDVNQICKAMSSIKFNVGEAMVMTAVECEAYKTCYHPIRTWLESLRWDGVKRIDKLFIEYFNTKVSILDDISKDEVHYRRYLATAFMLAAVGRALEPGSKWDIMLVLAGKPALGKSMFVEILGGEYAKTLYDMGTDKHSLQAMDGAWFVEFPEISAVSSKDVSRIKAFISATSDTYLPNYGRTTKTRKRTCVFIWTLNPKAEDDGFLRDTTGNRKFWVVDVLSQLDFEGLIRDREQLFAEALDMYSKGERSFTYISDPRAHKRSEQVQMEKMDVDAWQPRIQEWVEAHKDEAHKFLRNNNKPYWYYTLTEIMQSCLQLWSAKDHTRDNRRRVKKCMRALGFEDWRFGNERGMSREIQKWEDL